MRPRKQDRVPPASGASRIEEHGLRRAEAVFDTLYFKGQGRVARFC